MLSDHASLVIDLDQPGHPFDAGWEAAEARIAARTASLTYRVSRRRGSVVFIVSLGCR